MAVCDVCKMKRGDRIISRISMCGECFSKLEKLRNNDYEMMTFFSDSRNLVSATEEARDYFNRIISEKKNVELMITQAKEKADKEAYKEARKQEFAHSFEEYYEYDVKTILNVNKGQVDKDKILELLTSMSQKGYKLHTVYSNELGKNAIGILGFGINATVCEDVFIFERRIKNIHDIDENINEG